MEENRALLDRAERAGRDLTPAEREEFDRRMEEIDRLGEQITRQERLGDVEQELRQPLRGPVVAVRDLDLPRATSDAEWRALGPEESLREHLYRAGLVGGMDTTDVTPGAFLRAVVLGPRSEAERRALAESSDSTGGYTVPDVLAVEFIDRMRRASVMNRVGVRTVPLTSDKTTIARLVSDPVPTWRAENALIGDSDPSFDAVVLRPRSLAVLVKVSRELLEDSVNIEQALTTALTQSMAQEMDRAILFGSGSNNEPLGLTNVAGVNVVDMGANGRHSRTTDRFSTPAMP
ncbi:MAG: phage major capsid protein [Firmicutes bacterium]|nr:phage major capsid protein [Bacillota bacterium]